MNNAIEMTVTSEAAMKDLGARLAPLLVAPDGPRTLELIGDIGAGKTTLVKGLAAGLGVTEEVASPSFTISRVYDASDGFQLYHYDFYRLTDAGILRDELAEVLTDTHAVTVIEWAQIVDDVLPDNHVRLTIRAVSGSETTRSVLIYGLDGAAL